MIALSLDRWEVEAGTLLPVRVRWAPDTRKMLCPLVVKVGWRTEGRGDVERETVHEARRAIKGEECLISLPIPSEGPLSYDGKLIRIIWEVSAAPEPGDVGEPAPAVSAVFRVVPRPVAP
jgi:hypothetical protein